MDDDKRSVVILRLADYGERLRANDVDTARTMLQPQLYPAGEIISEA
ncbi:hypothetical protein LFL97_07630 [Burkholderia sp. JSH-S8]|nr:hypothetical protein LFL97_07630 [Burkholderia sp. JSH-S8]